METSYLRLKSIQFLRHVVWVKPCNSLFYYIFGNVGPLRENEIFLPPLIEGRHRILYFNIQRSEKYSTPMCYQMSPDKPPPNRTFDHTIYISRSKQQLSSTSCWICAHCTFAEHICKIDLKHTHTQCLIQSNPIQSWWPCNNFYRTRVRSLGMLVTNSLTDSLTHWLTAV